MTNRYTFHKLVFAVIFFLLININQFSYAKSKIVIYSAASTSNAITEIVNMYEKENNVKIITSFASSSTLAKQINNGAKADIFLSANINWIDYLAKKDKIDLKSKRDLLSNSLVIITSKDKNFNIKMQKDFDFYKSFNGRLAIGDPEHVPAGIYAKEALVYMNWWNLIKNRLARTMDVRGALNLVERKECELGIVYLSDVKTSKSVKVISTFPQKSHNKIIYPITLVKGANKESKRFFDFLLLEKSKKVFIKYGFGVIEQ